MRTLGLDPNHAQLNNFMAAAGVGGEFCPVMTDSDGFLLQYVQAQVLNNLTDPPYIHGSWAIADYAVRR